jgi:hypothetical protein
MYGEVMGEVVSHIPSWDAEESWGAGNLCYAATAVAIHKSLRGTNLTQTEVAHNECMRLFELQLFSNRGDDIKNYALLFGLEPGAAGVPYSAANKEIVQAGKDILGQIWGTPLLEGLTVVQGGVPTDGEAQICRIIEEGGLVVLGNQMHYVILYGYTVYESELRKFKIWDPANGSNKVLEAGELDDYEDFLYLT